MKKFYLFAILICTVAFAFADGKKELNWVQQSIDIDGTIRAITSLESGKLFMIGNSPNIVTSNSSTSDWESLDIYKPNWKFNEMSFSGDTGYAVSGKPMVVNGDDDLYCNGVILKSTDRGQTWIQIPNNSIGVTDSVSNGLDGSGVYNIQYDVVHCVSPDTVFISARWSDCEAEDIVSHNSIFKSCDGGLTWNEIPVDIGTTTISTMACIDNNLFIGASKVFLKYNLDTEVVSNLDTLMNVVEEKMMIYRLDVMNDTTMTITTTADGIYKTTDSGLSFTKIEGSLGGFDSFFVSDSVIITIGVSSKSYATVDGGTTWNNCYPGTSIYRFGGIVNDSLIGLSTNNIYKIAVADLEAGNYTWHSQVICNGSRLRSMHNFDDGSSVIATYEALLIRSTDFTQTWENCVTPDDMAQVMDIDHGNISSFENSTLLSTRRIKRVDLPSSSDYSDYYMSGYLFWSDDSFETITVQKNKYFGEKYEEIVSANPSADGAYSLDIYNSQIIDSLTAYVYINWKYASSTDESDVTYGRVFKTSDRGATWDTITPNLGSNFITTFEFNGETGYIAGGKTLFKTTDAGETITDLMPKLNALADDNIYCSSVETKGADTLYISTTADGIFYSYDGGETFNTFTGVAGANAIYSNADNNILALGSSSKTQFTSDNGQTWEACSPGSTIFGYNVVGDSIIAFGKGNIYKLAISELDTESSSDQIDQSTMLNIQNYPDRLMISSNNQMINQCRVFSIAGQLLFNKTNDATTIEISKQTLPKGVYILAVQCGSAIETRKIMID